MLRNETAASPDRQAAALRGLRAYQDAPRQRPARLAPARFRKGRARLLDYGRKGNTGRAVIFVPSLINPPFILDLAPDISLLRWLEGEGFRPFLLDWKTPGAESRQLDLTAHVEHILLPLIAKFAQPPILVGYCLGGTIALAAACAAPVAGLAMIAAPWRFSGFGTTARAKMAALWQAARPTCEALGVVPMEVLQAGFWQLDPARTIAKYEAFAALAPGSAAARGFIALEDWANGGGPLPLAVGAQLFDQFIMADLPGRGEWRIGGAPVGPAALDCPSIDFVSLSDRIVPAATAADLADRRNLGAGHVGMIIGRSARAQLWQPLADWIRALPPTR